jgi:hypothetical protein
LGEILLAAPLHQSSEFNLPTCGTRFCFGFYFVCFALNDFMDAIHIHTLHLEAFAGLTGQDFVFNFDFGHTYWAAPAAT